MRSLTVCGSAGTHPGPGAACSAYLVEDDGFKVLLDCGNGSLANLQRSTDVADIDAVVISHLHPDHIADLFGLYYALRFHPSGPRSVPVHGPPGLLVLLALLIAEESRPTLADHLAHVPTTAGATVELGPFRAAFGRANHPIAHPLTVRLEIGDSSLLFTGDTAPSDSVVAAATGVDLLVCDATWSARATGLPPGIHCTGTEAGEVAARAGVGRLLATHILPTSDRQAIADEARAAFDGDVIAAYDLLELQW